MNSNELNNSLTHLALLLEDGSAAYNVDLVVCGGSALIACGLVSRVTKDVDVVALRDQAGGVLSPAPLPKEVLEAAKRTANDLGLPADWLNNGPSSGPGGLYQTGLPEGILERLHTVVFGSSLTVHFIGRLDQICFKLYAAVDQMGSYHGQDLAALTPNLDELKFAIEWVKTQDCSEGFLQMLTLYLKSTGDNDAVQFI